VLYCLLKFIARAVLVLIGRWQVIGLKNVPQSGPLLIVCNHTSYWDPIMVGCAINRRVHFMAKAELFSYPVLGQILRGVRAFPIKRGQSDRNALRTAINILKEGNVVAVFPEGTRSKTRELLPFKPGINMIAYKAQSPILPMAVINSRKVLLGWFFPVRIRIGKPLLFPCTDQRPSSEEFEELARKSRTAVAELLEIS